MAHSKTKEQFINDANVVHGDIYNYSLSEYVNNKTKIKIICKEHGVFEQTPQSHIKQKSGCGTCSYIERGDKRKNTTEQFIINAKKIHGDRYDYSLVEYTGIKNKVEIVCSEHGSFMQIAGGHIHGKQGCPFCWEANRIGGHGGYNNEFFINNNQEKTALARLYVIEMVGKSDHFIKVGITKRTIKERYAIAGMGDKYLNKTIIHEIPMFLYDAWLLEQKILDNLKEYQYFPNCKFNGQTECLKPKQEVFNKIKDIILG